MQPARDIHATPDAARRGQRYSVRIPLLIVLWSAGFTGMSLLPAAAQVAASTPQATVPQATASSPDDIKQREQELEATRAQQKNAADQQQKFKADIAAIGQDRSKLNQQLIDIAAQVRSVETRIGDAEARLHPLDTREAQIRGSLDSRRSEIVEVLAALQRAGRRTPPALLVRPEDALQSLRTAMLLGAVIPELRTRAEKLAGDLGELVALRKAIATERDQLAGDRDKLKDDQTRLASRVRSKRTWRRKARAPSRCPGRSTACKA
jgi:septal ring factor EnvC (AmiA/AmiB activator)